MTMRYSLDHKRRTRQRILRTAARQIRAHGLEGPAVATVMQASGLTHGGFYKHFRNKDDLLAGAFDEALHAFRERLLPIARRAPPGEQWKAMVEEYLSIKHCDHPEAGCPIAALAAEVSRNGPAIRRRFTEHFQSATPEIAEMRSYMPGRTDAERREAMAVIFASMSGAIAVARAMTDPAMKRRLLTAVKKHLLRSF